jgi:parallel beta-helix repeat protein
MGKRAVLVLVLFFLTASCLTKLPDVKAEHRTIIVPDNYPTISAAIGNATNGDTILVRSGTYEGPINKTIIIDKSISIIGESTQDTIINLYPAYSERWFFATPIYTYSDAITITADSCALQDLTFHANPGGFITANGNQILIANDKILTGQTTGVIVKGSNCRVTNNNMNGYIQVNGTCNQIDANYVLTVQVAGSFNIIKDNTCQGLGLSYATNNVFLRNKVSTDMRGYSGVDLKWSNANFFYKNVISGFNVGGFRFWFSSDNTVKANTVADSLLASLNFGASFNNLFCLNNFVDNPRVYDQYSDSSVRNIYPNMTLSTNIWSDGGLGNYWGDYQTKYPNATEVDSTGVGNIPYVINDNNTDPYPLIARYGISTATIQLPDWTNLDLPVLRPTPSFPPPPSPSPSPNPSPTPSPTASPSPSPSPSPLPTEPFPTLAATVVSGASATLVGAGLIIYFKQRKR